MRRTGWIALWLTGALMLAGCSRRTAAPYEALWGEATSRVTTMTVTQTGVDGEKLSISGHT